jgi:ribosomal protein S18 acetylase RimI-like enzyme
MSAFQPALYAAAPSVRRATLEDLPRIARVFAAAFATDPVFRWLTRDRRSYHAALERFFLWTLRSRAVAQGETWLAVNGLAAAAWIPPYSSTSPRLLDELRMLRAILQLTGISRLPRGAAMAAAVSATQPKEPCFYLAFIGVAPRLQGAGLGSLLLERTLSRVDAARAHAYLENSNPDNLSLYQRAGFSVTHEIIARPDAPPLFAMWRPARTGAAPTVEFRNRKPWLLPEFGLQGSSTMSQ